MTAVHAVPLLILAGAAWASGTLEPGFALTAGILATVMVLSMSAMHGPRGRR